MTFVRGIIKDPMKQESIAQAIFACCKQRSVLSYQFSLTISVDNTFSSKWLNSTIYNFGFACSYDEVVRFKQNITLVCEKTVITKKSFFFSGEAI